MAKTNTVRSMMFAGLVLCGASHAALSACTQADTRGNWQAYSTNSSGLSVYCKLGVSATGTISNSTCTATNGVSANFTNGKITLSSGPSCTFKGSFRLGGELNSVKSATMTRDKLIIQGVGTYPGGNFTFNLIRL
jgi:hypothetical protein